MGNFITGNTTLPTDRTNAPGLGAATQSFELDADWLNYVKNAVGDLRTHTTGWINVKDYGATGNGSTDDTAAFQSALTAAVGGKAVYVPAGTYKISSSLVLTASVAIEGTGTGSVLQVSGTGITLLTATSVADVVIRRLKLVGSGATGGTGNAITLTDVTGAVVTDCTVQSFENQGVAIVKSSSGCSDVTVERCTITGHTKATAGGGIAASSSTRIRVVNNVLSGNRIGVTFNDVTDGVIRGNVSRANNDIGITVDGVTPNAGLSARNVIADNQCIGNLNATYAGIYLGNFAADTSVVGNLCTGNSGDGIRAFGGVSGLTISGNTCRSNAHAGIALSSCGGGSITGNTVRSNAYQGIDVFRCFDFTVQGNTLTGNDTGGGSRSGLRVMDCDGVSVAGNRVGNHTNEVELAQTGIAAWSSGTTYNINEKVTLTGNTYRSLAYSNLNNSPDVSPTFWVLIGAGYTYLSDVIATGNNLIGTHTSPISDATNKGVFANNITTSGTASTFGKAGNWAKNILTATTTWDPPSVAAGASTTTTVPVTGATFGDTVVPGLTSALQGMTLTGFVSSSGTVTVVLTNPTAGAIDLGSGTLRATVLQF